jgi:hypothetical protein
MSFKNVQNPAGIYFPEPDCMVTAAARQCQPVRTERHAIDGVLMTFENTKTLARFCAPDSDRSIL